MNPFEKQIHDYEEYLQILKRSKSALQSYLSGICKFTEWITQKQIYDLKEITSDHIKEYQLIMMDKKYSINTVYSIMLIIKRFFYYLEKSRIILCNPAEKMELPLLGDRLPKIIPTEQEMQKLLNAPNTGTPLGIRDRAMLELLYSTGIRRQECRDLKVHDIDYNGGYLRINNGKGGKDRVLPIGKKACDWLKEYLLKIRQNFTKKNPDERALFISRRGNILTGYMINLIVRKYSKKAGLTKRITAHAIRRAFATHMLRNEANPMYIQRILGHSGMGTLNRYIKVAGADLKKTHTKTHPREKQK